MNTLAIETATETCSVALEAGGQLWQRYEHAPRRHADLLLPWIQELLREAGVKFSDLDVIAFTQGPGSFTSLRIGIGVVQGLAWASNCPVVPVSSLAATAQMVASDGFSSVLVALDARMGEVFTGLYRIDSDGIMQLDGVEQVCPPGAVQVPPGDDVMGVGIGFDRYTDLCPQRDQLAEVKADVWPHAQAVLTLAKAWLLNNEPLAAELAQPVYLRDNVAIKTVDR
jgi:tRNA threonylcarbamoyladenosine biosynthesis protein TsaB